MLLSPSQIWTLSFAFIGVALRFLSNHSPVRRYIADSSYWLYLVHVPLVMALQVAVSQLPWPWFVKYPLVLVVTFTLLFASYRLLRALQALSGKGSSTSAENRALIAAPPRRPPRARRPAE